MQAKFIGGPYNCIKLDHNDIKLYTNFVLVGRRKFVLMPPFDHWEAVRRGDEDKNDDFGAPLAYELDSTAAGMRAVYDPGSEAFENALRDQQAGRSPTPPLTPFTGAYYRCIPGEWALSQSGCFPIIDEKGRAWACSEISREEAEQVNVFAHLGAVKQMHHAVASDERPRWNILHCESVDELPATLADIID